MILAHIPLPCLAIPVIVTALARGREIDLCTHDVPFGADTWIGCEAAWPHIDNEPYWNGKLFLTLSIISTHTVGDADAPAPDLPVPSGTLFVIDPWKTHWIAPVHSRWSQRKRSPWLGVQWEVRTAEAPELARQIVAGLGGKWIATDARYRDWNGAD